MERIKIRHRGARPAKLPEPHFCPFCGSRVAEWPHDDNCPHPYGVLLLPTVSQARVDGLMK